MFDDVRNSLHLQLPKHLEHAQHIGTKSFQVLFMFIKPEENCGSLRGSKSHISPGVALPNLGTLAPLNTHFTNQSSASLILILILLHPQTHFSTFCSSLQLLHSSYFPFPNTSPSRVHPQILLIFDFVPATFNITSWTGLDPFPLLIAAVVTTITITILAIDRYL